MMRQYELVERVLNYDPKADEALLNRAYVYAMKAHGNQKRASGDPYFSHPARSRRHPHRPEARRRHRRDGAAARRHRGHAHHAGGDRPAVRARDRQARRRPHQDPPPRPRLQEGRAGGELPQAPRRHLERHPRAARQARRPAAQHAHARAHEARDAQAHLGGDARHLCAARRPHGHGGDARGAGGPRLPLAAPGGLRGGDGEARRAAQVERGARRGDPRGARRQGRRGRHRRGGLGPREEALRHLAQDGEQADQPRAALRHLRLPRHRRLDRRLLPRAGRRAHHVAHGAGPLQGLHLDAQAEQLPVDPHHRRRPAPPARRAADPHARHARHRRVRRRRARALQGRRPVERRSPAAPRRRARCRRTAGPTCGCAGWSRRCSKGSNPEEFLEHTKLELFQDQVFCFTPKGRLIALPRGATPLDFAYAVHTDIGNAAVGRLRQRPPRADRHASCATATRWRSRPQRATSRPPPGRTSSSRGARARRSGARRAMRCASSIASSGAGCLPRASSRWARS